MGLLLLFGSAPGNNRFIGITCNTYREIGPIACYPRRARDEDYQETGDWVQEAWDYAQEPRDYISARGAMHVRNPADSIVWTAEEPAPNSWTLTRHSHQVDGTEGQFDIEIDGNKVGEARPWWGYFGVYGINTDEGKGSSVSYCVGPSNTHYVAYIDADTRAVLGRSPNTMPLAFDYQTSLFDGIETVSIWFDPVAQAVYLWTEEAGGVFQRTTTDNGATWSVATTITSSGTPEEPRGKVLSTNSRYIYWRDGTAIKGSIYDAAGNALATEFTAIAAGVDADTGLDFDERTIGEGRQQIVLWYMASGSLIEAYSDDGQTFV